MKFKIATPFSEQEIGNDYLCWIDYDGKRDQMTKAEIVRLFILILSVHGR